ncbi:class I SAM-dependent methyltransferase [Thiohalobacter thiocyanaticus]|uniref:Class I SAM-dependent methyltransferase n=1 Tax=Thiohalobacter thiocyanaticus TaxID=585455 RepID=A0A426QIW6_9GAMM|nr:methyltransferase [Thiohalobacter thiocyanaticus]RRQ21712.1 class I SAM-dependent methyltransferase [Thiohalobacter thiocyanaticus]
MPADDYLHRIRQDLVFTETLRDQEITFHTTWGLFSPREIDEGTRLLLRHIEVNPGDDCFDLGCGYGPVGLTLARLAPEGRTLMVDKDFLAVEYANRNAELNGITNARARLSNVFQHVDPELKFDLIASNVPAKVGKELLAIMLHDAHARLRPGGRLWVVSITGLRRLFEREMKAVFGNYDKVKQGRQYTVALAVRD